MKRFGVAVLMAGALVVLVVPSVSQARIYRPKPPKPTAHAIARAAESTPYASCGWPTDRWFYSGYYNEWGLYQGHWNYGGHYYRVFAMYDPDTWAFNEFRVVYCG